MQAARAVDTIWYTRCPDPTPLGLAARLGWLDEEFREDRIAVRTLHEVPDPALHLSYLDHHQRYSIRQGGNVPALWARANGADTRVIGLSWVEEYQAILTLPNSGIRKPADLRGKRLAIPQREVLIDHAHAGALRGFQVALAMGEVAETEVKFIPVHVTPTAHRDPLMAFFGGYGVFMELVTALLIGQVDAIYVKGARGAQTADQIGAHEVIDLRRCADPIQRANNNAPRPITVDAAMLRERPDLVERFLRRIADVGYWAAAHPEETVAYISQETDSSPRWVRQAYGAHLHLHQRVELSGNSIAALAAYKQFLFERGFLPRNFDLDEWIDPRPLEQVEREIHARMA